MSRLPFLRLLWLGLLEGDLHAVRALTIRHLDHEGPTLDLPCGPGLLADLFDGADYVGVDPDPGNIAAARAGRPGVFLCGPLDRVEVPDGRFSQVLAYRLFDALDDKAVRKVVQELARVSGVGGRLLALGALPARGPRRLLLSASGVSFPRDATRLAALLAPHFVVATTTAFRSGLTRRVALLAHRAAGGPR